MNFKLLFAYIWPLWLFPSALMAFIVGAKWLSIALGRWPWAAAFFILVLVVLLVTVFLWIHDWANETIRRHWLSKRRG